jgi:endonuclease YncB( thermonuclease family)
MTRIGSTIWQTYAPRVIPLQPARRSTFAIFGRAVMLIGATVAFGFSTVASAPRADQAGVARETAAEGRAKDAARLPNWPQARARTELRQAAQKEPAIDPASPASLFHAGPLADAARFTMSALSAPPVDSFVPRPMPRPESEWKEEEFAQVGVVDGRTLEASGTRIRLVGLDLPMPEQVCRTLDGRLESCAVRAATQLELLTRGRRVTCHFRVESAGAAIGRCRIGTNDLTERMVKTGYTWQSAAAPARS